ncbi:nucleotidyltransferase domain-containing protein [Candidatus Bathyarchaeota archaeon]|nr:nucleotidyltransferase domain-containing protein [Candidatus Bathyarchaeota archaeon]
MKIGAQYPTVEHEQAAKAIVEFFSSLPDVEAVILVGSCARGKASPDSCLDITILVSPETPAVKRTLLEQKWDDFYEKTNIFKTLQKVGKYSHVDLSFIDGCFTPKPRGWTSGPDEFELEIGNALVYAVLLWEHSDYLRRLKSKWLPYYDETLRRERLDMVRLYCINNLDHVPLYVNRSLYFQAFDRLYNAFQEFLQALFISRRVYPIAYHKWIREQIEENLGMPELYKQLPKLFEIRNFESRQIAEKAKHLRNLFENYIKE